MILLLWAALAVAAPRAVWIDTDPSVGERDRDVDDGVALLQALGSPELAVRGVSVVFGNAPLDRADPIARQLLATWAPEVPVHTGASGPGLAPTPASAAIVAALEREPLTLLVLGPATNVATALHARPDLAARVVALVAVAGRRPGHRFTTGTTNLRGHRDFNLEQDPGAFAELLAHDLPIVLTGFEVSSQVWVTADHLARWTGPPRVLVEPARGWLALWTRTFGVDGFNPFDTLAVGWATTPELLGCAPAHARLEEGPDDRTEPALQGDTPPSKPYLHVRAEGPGRAVAWCAEVQADAFLADLERRLRTGPTTQAHR